MSVNVFPISQSQNNIWETERLLPGFPVNNICASIRINGRIDADLITRCINRVLENDLSLRTRIAVVNGNPFQFHVAYEEEQIPFFDFSNTDEDGISRWENTIAQTAMPLCECPLYQFYIYKSDEAKGGILIKVHHMISDGWAILDLVNRIFSVYTAALSGKEAALEPTPSYERYVSREREYLASPLYEADMKYWYDRLDEYGGERAFLKKSEGGNYSHAGERCTFKFPEVINNAIADFCKSNFVSPFTVYCAALAVHIRRMSGRGGVVFGVPVVNRPEYTDKLTGGMYANMLPFFIKPDLDLCAGDMIDALNEDWYDLLRHQRFPLGEIRARAEQSDPEDRLYDIVLSFQDEKVLRSDETMTQFSGKWIYSGYQPEQLIIHITSLDGENRFSADYDYLTQFYSREDIEILHKNILKIISEILSHRQTPVRELNLVDGDELEKVLYTFNQTDSSRVLPSVAGKFAGIVEKTPDKTAIIYNGERITYADLYKEVLDTASRIYELCKGEKENIIALCLPRGVRLVAAMLAANASGNAWVILPPELPQARISYFLDDSGATVLLTQSQYIPLFIGNTISTLFLDCMPQGELKLEHPVRLSGDNLAYVAYTSGAAGVPKGVMIEQAGLVNFSVEMEAVYAGRGVLSCCNTGLDLFIMETVSALLCGKTVIMSSDYECDSPAALAGLIKEYAVSFLSAPPSRLEKYISNAEFAQALYGLESVVFAGEAVSGEFVRRLEKLTRGKLYNLYDLPEAAIGVSCKCISHGPSFSVGKPMNNCSFYVLDEYMNPLPVDAPGDLYISGVCVGRGYLNDDEATGRSFTPDKFKIDRRMYRSGDVAKWDRYGELNIIRRAKPQIMPDGCRIEPQEISSMLLAYPKISQAAVRIEKEETGVCITAYYTSPSEIKEETLRNFCGIFLPEYMIPRFFVRVEAIPAAAGGGKGEK